MNDRGGKVMARPKSKFSELTKCPFCGHNTYFGKGKGRNGIITYITTYEKGIEGAKIFCKAKSDANGKAYCEKCRNLIGNIYDNTVTIAADAIMRENKNLISA